MKLIPFYQVDAFTNKLFSGNPAAICILEDSISVNSMQFIAQENNLSETAFVNLSQTPFQINWFSPTDEVRLCGHATLAAARIMFDDYLPKSEKEIVFDSHSGFLVARKLDNLIYLDFPRDDPVEILEHSSLTQILGIRPDALYKGKDDFLVILGSERVVRSIQPDLDGISSLKSRGVIVTARGEKYDFVSRFFAPGLGVDEDPVTGSAHTVLVPYWSKVIGKKKLRARQVSKRGGNLECELIDDRVLIGGETVRYLQGQITI